MVSNSSEGSASKISIVRRRSVTRMTACGSWASDRGQASMLHQQQRQQSSKSTGHFDFDTSRVLAVERPGVHEFSLEVESLRAFSPVKMEGPAHTVPWVARVDEAHP